MILRAGLLYPYRKRIPEYIVSAVKSEVRKITIFWIQQAKGKLTRQLLQTIFETDI